MDENRIIHSINVAKKMMEIGKQQNLTEEEIEDLYILGYLHDIGYTFGNNINHNIIGGNILKNNNYKYWKEVYYHGILKSKYISKYLDILNYADMSVDKYGKDVGFEKRLEDIKERYGNKSIQYKNSKELIDELKKKVI